MAETDDPGRVFTSLIKRSENYALPGKVRTGIRHDLLDLAIKKDDEDAWKQVGNAFIRAAEQDDLVPRLSDRFIDAAPDHIFLDFDPQNAACRFTGWRRKTLKAHGLW